MNNIFLKSFHKQKTKKQINKQANQPPVASIRNTLLPSVSKFIPHYIKNGERIMKSLVYKIYFFFQLSCILNFFCDYVTDASPLLLCACYSSMWCSLHNLLRDQSARQDQQKNGNFMNKHLLKNHIISSFSLSTVVTPHLQIELV